MKFKRFRFIEKRQMEALAKRGHAAGYNRQLDFEALDRNPSWAILPDNTRIPVIFNMPHEHIAGEKVTPHMRVVFSYGGDRDITMDISQQDYDTLGEVEVEL